MAPPRTGRERFVAALAARLPFHYAWVILACASTAGFSRTGSAVATLSIFFEPLTREFGWSHTEVSSAVSVGGVLGALAAPALGVFLDRRGPRAMLLVAVALTGSSLFLLSFTQSFAWFFVCYCIARMSFGVFYDLGVQGSIVSWFLERRAFAVSVSTLVTMAGLVSMPLIAHFVIEGWDWRTAWAAIGVTALAVGFLPTFVLHAGKPEDLGMRMHGAAPAPAPSSQARSLDPEPAFTRAQAMRTSAFWLLSLFTLLLYPVQAGISLHQAPFLIERGLDSGAAARAVSTFALFSALSGFAFGFWPRRVPMRFALALVGLLGGLAAILMMRIQTAPQAYAYAALFGSGIGGLLTMLPIAWADYFGRSSFGAIRGAALTVQVVAQAAGPVVSGALRDWTGDYAASLATFAALAFAGAGVALAAAPPRAQAAQTRA
jgi:OFA family oxalate/formate antiporter-like MFS transporter